MPVIDDDFGLDEPAWANERPAGDAAAGRRLLLRLGLGWQDDVMVAGDETAKRAAAAAPRRSRRARRRTGRGAADLDVAADPPAGASRQRYWMRRIGVLVLVGAIAVVVILLVMRNGQRR